ncbi:MAG: GIY-YIG nuclease family protein [Candidatus Izemoplasma sp.]
MKIYYTVYKTTNQINGKVYIGVHKTKNINDDYLGSGNHLKYSIKKYGKENFTKKVLKVFTNPEDMFKIESLLVNEEFVNNNKTYNLKLGGEGGWDHINDLPQSEKQIRQRLAWHKAGVKAYQKKYKNNKVFANTQNLWRREKLIIGRATIKEKYPNGTWKGKTHSKQTKLKMSLAAKERLKDPKKNSQYGTMWIFNEKLQKSKKVKKDSYLQEGWKKGRKIY